MIRRGLFVAMMLVLAAPVAGLAASQVTFHVARDGSDDNPGTKAKPFATIEKARQVVRTVNKDMTGDVVVVVGQGVYRIDRTVTFEFDDSGFNGHDVVYRAEAGQSVVISGGKPVVGWKPDKDGRWKAPAPCDDFRQLYVGGVRATRAKGEPPAGLKLADEESYRTTAVDVADWRNPGDIEFCYQVGWTHTRCKVAAIRRDGDHAVIAMLQPYFAHARGKDGVQVDLPDYVENALELLDEPGEWYLDRSSKTVYYLPRPGEDLSKMEAIAPAVETLVDLRGTLDRPVHNIQFVGITFQFGTWLQPSKIGHVDVQANLTTDSDRSTAATDGGSQPGFGTKENEWFKMPANVVCRAARGIRFDRCTFEELGGAGLNIEYGSQDNVVSGCRFSAIAGTAVQVGDVLRDDHHPDDPRKIVKNNVIENCFIHDCCADYWGGAGVFVGYTDGTRIVHNEMCRLPYSAVSMGWGWGEQDLGVGADSKPGRYKSPTPSGNNRIEYNNIHALCEEINFGAGIQTLGSMPGTIIRGNYLHDFAKPKDPHRLASGIFLNEGSAFIEITSNLVHDVPVPASYSDRSKDRLATCREHGNFLDPRPEDVPWIAENAGLESAYQDLLKDERAR